MVFNLFDFLLDKFDYYAKYRHGNILSEGVGNSAETKNGLGEKNRRRPF